MNRRDLFRGLAGVAGGLILPPSVGEVAAEVERRWWSLGAMPGRPGNGIYLRHLDYAPILILSSDMGETWIDACSMYTPGGEYLVRDEVLVHARWLKEQGARDLMFYDRRRMPNSV